MKTNIVCIIDTETTYMNGNPRLIADLGYTIFDVSNPQGAVFKRRFLIKEVLANTKNFEITSAPNGEGWREGKGHDARYSEMLKSAFNLDVVSWNDAYTNLINDISIMGVGTVGAYNWKFDFSALEKTHFQTNHQPFLIPKGIDIICLWDLCATVLIDEDYYSFVDTLTNEDKHFMMSRSGKNIGSSANCMGKYLLGDIDYTEEHTALNDALLECHIFREVFGRIDIRIINDFLNRIKTPHYTKIRDKRTVKEKLLDRGFDVETMERIQTEMF